MRFRGVSSARLFLAAAWPCRSPLAVGDGDHCRRQLGGNARLSQQRPLKGAACGQKEDRNTGLRDGEPGSWPHGRSALLSQNDQNQSSSPKTDASSSSRTPLSSWSYSPKTASPNSSSVSCASASASASAKPPAS